MFTRVAVGRARAVREVRAAAPLMTALRAPVTARAPWLSGVLNAGAASHPRARPVAVVVEAHRQGRPEAAAFLSLRRPWSLELAGLPLGDPTARLLAARLPTSVLGSVRSVRLVRLVDELDDLAPAVLRSRDPRVLERWLPALLTDVDPRARSFFRATARLHAAIGELELAVAAGDGDTPRAGLLTLVDGEGRWPRWGPVQARAPRWARHSPD